MKLEHFRRQPADSRDLARRLRACHKRGHQNARPQCTDESSPIRHASHLVDNLKIDNITVALLGREGHRDCAPPIA